MKRILFIAKRALLILAVFGAVVLVVIRSSGHRAATPSSWTALATKVLPAARAYAKLLKTEGAPIPTFVKVQELVAKGLLGQDDLRASLGWRSASPHPWMRTFPTAW